MSNNGKPTASSSPVEKEPKRRLTSKIEALEEKSHILSQLISNLKDSTSQLSVDYDILSPRVSSLSEKVSSVDVALRSDLSTVVEDLAQLTERVQSHTELIEELVETVAQIRRDVETASDRTADPIVERLSRDVARLQKFVNEMSLGDSGLETTQRPGPSSEKAPMLSRPRYRPWTDRVEDVVHDDYVAFDDLMGVLQIIRRMNFSVKGQRDEAIALLDGLHPISPIASETERFPEKLHVNITVGIIADLLAKLRSAYDIGERYVDNATPNDKRFGSIDDAKVTVLKTVARLLEMRRKHAPARLRHFGAYDRDSFESAFGLSWL